LKTIIIDTNILFSSLLGKNKNFRDIILSQGNLNFYSAKYAIVELFKYKEKIRTYSNFNEDEILELLYSLLRKINLFDESTLSGESLTKAFDLCDGIDDKDIPFVAVTIELKGLLWTGDKELKNGLRSKGFDSFFEIG
jgi:predicted nucleic acid-binding protein